MLSCNLQKKVHQEIENEEQSRVSEEIGELVLERRNSTSIQHNVKVVDRTLDYFLNCEDSKRVD